MYIYRHLGPRTAVPLAPLDVRALFRCTPHALQSAPVHDMLQRCQARLTCALPSFQQASPRQAAVAAAAHGPSAGPLLLQRVEKDSQECSQDISANRFISGTLLPDNFVRFLHFSQGNRV